MAIIVRKPHVQKEFAFLMEHSCVPYSENTPSDPKSRRWNRMAGGPRRLIEVDRFSLWFSPALDRCRRERRTRRYVVHGSDFHRSPAVSPRPLLRRTNFSSCYRPPFSPDEFKVNLGHETVPRLSRGGGVGGDIGLAPPGDLSSWNPREHWGSPWSLCYDRTLGTGALGGTIRLGHL